MISTLRTQAACLDSVALDGIGEPWASIQNRIIDDGSMAYALRKVIDWQRAKACVDQRAAMQVHDDKTLDALDRLEYDARLSARNALTAAGIDVGMLGGLV